MADEKLLRAAQNAAETLVYFAQTTHPHGEFDSYHESFSYDEGFDYEETCADLCGADACDNSGCIEMKLRKGLTLLALIEAARKGGE